MRERRRTLLAGALLLIAALWYERPAPAVSIATDVAGPVPATVQTALDLGMLGTVVLSWTIQRLN